jgi:putative membrane protein insertion efficiency factor
VISLRPPLPGRAPGALARGVCAVAVCQRQFRRAEAARCALSCCQLFAQGRSAHDARVADRPGQGYRLLLSPWLGSACRFEPTCSLYAIGALQQHGALAGSYLTLRRLARCHPGCDGRLRPGARASAPTFHPPDARHARRTATPRQPS